MIIHYEKGRNQPSLERAIQIANILECTLDQLIDTEKYLDAYHNKLNKLNRY